MNTLKSTATFFFLVFLSWLSILNDNNNIATASRVYFPAMEKNDINSIKSISLRSRLETSGGLVECWTALLELKSCSNEIVLFFLDGQASIGGDCCRAIVFITRSCWPAMLTSLGFTVQEGDFLRGFCDALETDAPPPPLGPSPAPLADPTPVAGDDLVKLPALLD